MKPHLLPVYTDARMQQLEQMQIDVFWPPTEPKVEKDLQDIMVTMSEGQRNGVLRVLKTFSLAETTVGDEFWGGRFKSMFTGDDSPSAHRMASVFSMMELAVHGVFYNRINDLLHVNTPEFFLSYENEPALCARMKTVWDIIDNSSDEVSLGAFSFVEGVVLYSMFAYLKSFASNGLNLITNINRGINFSIRDENLHAVASAYCFRKKTRDKKPEELKGIHAAILDILRKVIANEDAVIEDLFADGGVDHIRADDLKQFVRARANTCLDFLGMPHEYEVVNDPISLWFYTAISNYSFNDFFSGIGNQYNRNWSATEFTWSTN